MLVKKLTIRRYDAYNPMWRVFVNLKSGSKVFDNVYKKKGTVIRLVYNRSDQLPVSALVQYDIDETYFLYQLDCREKYRLEVLNQDNYNHDSEKE